MHSSHLYIIWHHRLEVANTEVKETSSYRPIGQLPIMSKIFDKAVLKRLRPILEENRIIPDHQFGFRQKHSTIEQVYRIMEIISGTLEKTVMFGGVPRHPTSV
jgi:hypothetical protein